MDDAWDLGGGYCGGGGWCRDGVVYGGYVVYGGDACWWVGTIDGVSSTTIGG